jgi:hypothetical protein
MTILETKWSVNESLLQSYRSIFISSQSFLLAVGAFSFEKFHMLNILLSILSLAMIFGIWIPVVRARRRIVDYYKYSLRLDDAQREQLKLIAGESDYVLNGNRRNEANQFLKDTLALNQPVSDLRETRKKVDVFLPLGFVLIWLIFLLTGIFPSLAQYLM